MSNYDEIKYPQNCPLEKLKLKRFPIQHYQNKVLSLLEACFDLILGSSLHVKIQIMCGKITENLGFKSLLRKVKFFLFFFTEDQS